MLRLGKYPDLSAQVRLQVAPGVWGPLDVVRGITNVSMTHIANGLYGEASFDLPRTLNEDGLLSFYGPPGERRIGIYLDAQLIFLGFMKTPTRQLAPTQSRTINLIGIMDGANNVEVDKAYVHPGGADLAFFYYDLANDYILPSGLADRTEIALLGVTKENLRFSGKLREAITDLASQTPDYVFWGIRLDADGKTTFFVHMRDASAAPIYTFDPGQAAYDRTLDRYAPHVVSASHVEETLEMVNAARIEGGEVDFPNLVKNPSFEEPVVGSGGVGNLVINGSFDTDSIHGGGSDPFTGWCVTSGSPTRQGSGEYLGIAANDGNNYVSFDCYPSSPETMITAIGGIVAGHRYNVEYYIRRESLSNSPRPIGKMTLYWYSGWDGASFSGLLGSLTQDWPTTDPSFGQVWKKFTISDIAPVGARYAVLEPSLTTGAAGEGIDLDTVSFYDANMVFQRTWRLQIGVTPAKQERNDEGGAFAVVDWAYSWRNGGVVPPTDASGRVVRELDEYGVEIRSLAASGHRIVNSAEGEIEVKPQTSYQLQAWIRSVGGNTTTNVTPIKMGVIALDANGELVNFSSGDPWWYVFLTDVYDAWGVYGGSFAAPEKCVRLRIFIEPQAANVYYVDGVMLTQSPVVLTEFYPADHAIYWVTTQEVGYDPASSRYKSVQDPPAGWSRRENKYQNEFVVTRSEANRYAKTIFDVLALPFVHQTVELNQTELHPVVVQPNGYFKLGDYKGKTFPKLWPARVEHVFSNTGLRSSIELEREAIRIDNLLTRDRDLTVHAVGGGSEDAATFFEPWITEEYVVVPGDSHLSDSGRPGAASGDVLVFPLTEAPVSITLHVAVRGFGLWPAWVESHYDVDPTKIRITLPVGDSFSTGDQLVIVYEPVSASGANYAWKTEKFVAATGGIESFRLSLPAVSGGVKVYVRGFLLPGSQFDMVIASSAPNLGQPCIAQVLSGAGLVAGDDVIVAYQPATLDAALTISEGFIMGSTADTNTTFVPYRFSDGTYAIVTEVGGLADYGATYSQSGSVFTIHSSDIRPGDRLVARYSYVP